MMVRGKLLVEVGMKRETMLRMVRRATRALERRSRRKRTNLKKKVRHLLCVLVIKGRISCIHLR